MTVFRVTLEGEFLVSAGSEEQAREKAAEMISWDMDSSWLDAEDTGEEDDGGPDIIR